MTGAGSVAGPPDPTGSDVEILTLATGADVVRARHRVRERATAIGCDLVLQTKVVTAASELARNTLVHGHGGEVRLETVHADGPGVRRIGLALTFHDTGPGITDMDLAMTRGWTTGGGLGLGLPGSQQLVHEFAIDSAPGEGTTVRVAVWRRAR